ncbi:hypothetical protein AYO22_07491 [Fonsecaea multimorphosa]|nr:hypothetical protein AYO22_07491 [Fonsecaea multimorphosa]
MEVEYASKTTDKHSNAEITSHSGRMPPAAASRPGDALRQNTICGQGEARRAPQTSPQRKRTADGAIKRQRVSPISDPRDGLLPHDDHRRNSDVKLKMDLDILRRRIAVIEAQEQGSFQHRSGSKRAEPVGLGQQQQQQTRGTQYPEPENSLMDWKEVTLR